MRSRCWTRVEYEKLIDPGVFQPGEPIELIGDELVIAEPQDALHYTVVCRAAKALEAAFGGGGVVRNQGPVGLDDESDPEPDVAMVPGALEDDRSGHPSRPALTVEVAESAPDPAARFGWGYARRDVFDASTHVSPLATPAANILVGALLP